MPTKTPESGRFRCSSRWTRRSPSTSTSKQWSDTTSESSPLPAPENPISFRTYGDIVEELNRQRNESLDKPHYVNALDRIRQDVVDYKAEHAMTDSKPIDEDFIKQLDEWGRGAVDEFKISDRSGVYAWATSRLTLIDNLKRAEKEKRTTGGLDIEGIRELVERETRLT